VEVDKPLQLGPFLRLIFKPLLAPGGKRISRQQANLTRAVVLRAYATAIAV
jgi:hypothetical protein